MIKTKLDLKFYLQSDLMMNRGYFKPCLKQVIHNFLYPDYIVRYLKYLRKVEYINNSGGGIIKRYIYTKRFYMLGIKLGFTIPINVFGYGLVIPHFGTIVVGGGNKIGNYCVLHTSTCITAGNKQIGDAFYLSTGAKIIHNITLKDNVSVTANSVVTRSVDGNNILIGGMPSCYIKDSEPWYIRDGEKYIRRYEECEKLKTQMYI